MEQPTTLTNKETYYKTRATTALKPSTPATTTPATKSPQNSSPSQDSPSFGAHSATTFSRPVVVRAMSSMGRRRSSGIPRKAVEMSPGDAYLRKMLGEAEVVLREAEEDARKEAEEEGGKGEGGDGGNGMEKGFEEVDEAATGEEVAGGDGEERGERAAGEQEEEGMSSGKGEMPEA